MKYQDWLEGEILPAVRSLGEIDPEFFGRRAGRAIVMAMVQQECGARGGGVSTLASRHRNLAGIKFSDPGDVGRYPMVELGPNQYERERQRYRVYRSFEHCLINIRWHLLKSGHYRRFVDWENPRGWLERVAGKWAVGNPGHVAAVLAHYDRWVRCA